MEYAYLPILDKKVSRVGLGTWAIGGWLWGGTNEKEAIEALLKGFEMGINLVDTAPVYGFGLSEEIVSKALKKSGKRDQIVIATKVGLDWKNEKVFANASRKRIQQEIEDSLRRLDVETIDLYQVHWPDPSTPIDETAEAIKALYDQGKIKAIGVSNYSPHEMELFQKVAPLHTLQLPFNLFEKEAEEREVSYCLEKKIFMLGYGPLCRGLLTGKMNAHSRFPKTDLRHEDPKFNPPLFYTYLNCIEDLKKWGVEHGNRSLLSLAIRWVLDKKIDVALWGVRKPEQLAMLSTLWDWKLSETDRKEIDQILQRHLI